MKKALSLILVLAMVFALTIPAFAGSAATGPNTATLEGVGFHCNHGGNGNGKTDVIFNDNEDFEFVAANYINAKGKVLKNVKVADTGTKFKFDFERIDETTWKLISEDYYCVVCGNNVWASYSNKSGVPNGKNIEVNPYIKSEPPVDPIVFDITVKHRDIDTGAYLVYPETGEFFASDDEAYIEWLNSVDGFVFLNLYLAAIRANDKADLAITWDGEKFLYICSDVTITRGDGLFMLDVFGGVDDNDYTALVTPLKDGSYEITFWYGKVTPITPDLIRYYAVCQLWNDLMWGADGYGMKAEDFNVVSGDLRETEFQVGVKHREDLMEFWGLDDPNVRYNPFPVREKEKVAYWSNEIELSVVRMFDALGISLNIDKFVVEFNYVEWCDYYRIV